MVACYSPHMWASAKKPTHIGGRACLRSASPPARAAAHASASRKPTSWQPARGLTFRWPAAHWQGRPPVALISPAAAPGMVMRCASMGLRPARPTFGPRSAPLEAPYGAVARPVFRPSGTFRPFPASRRPGRLLRWPGVLLLPAARVPLPRRRVFLPATRTAPTHRGEGGRLCHKGANPIGGPTLSRTRAAPPDRARLWDVLATTGDYPPHPK